jgi:uncharacterized protein
MSLLTDPMFYATALPAVTLYGLSKGGFAGVSLLSLPLMSLIMPPVQAATILLPVLLVQDAVTVASYRNSWDGATLWALMPGALLGMLLAWLTAAVVSQGLVRLAVGMIAIAFCLNAWFLVPRKVLKPGETGMLKPHNRPLGRILGFLSGYTSFVVHAGGPPYLLYTVPRLPSKEVLAGTMGIMFAALNALKVPPYLSLGQFTRDNMIAALVLMPVAVIANLAGVYLLQRMSPVLFYRVITVLTFGVGITLILQGIKS